MEVAILARHGESEYSANGLTNGDPRVACPLTAVGLAQAHALGGSLANEPLELCIITAFERTRATALAALAGRGVPLRVVEALNDPDYGEFEGRSLDEYRGWLADASSDATPPGGSESRRAIVSRYAEGFRQVLARPERTLLVVAHSLPLAFALAASEGTQPRPRAAVVPYATPYLFEHARLAAAVGVLERWLVAPDW
jgi:probable phosphoglycerate mutase